MKNELNRDGRTEKAQRRTLGSQVTVQEAGYHSEEGHVPWCWRLTAWRGDPAELGVRPLRKGPCPALREYNKTSSGNRAYVQLLKSWT